MPYFFQHDEGYRGCGYGTGYGLTPNASHVDRCTACVLTVERGEEMVRLQGQQQDNW